MPREDNVGALADEQVLFNLDARLAKAVDLAEDRLGIDHDAAGDNRLNLGTKDAARNQRKFVFLAVKNDGVPRVRAALITDDDVVLRSEKIDDLAFRLVAPL